MKILAKIEKNKACWILLLITVIFFLLRLPSLIEPHWYGDEGIYEVIGLALKNNHLLYKDIWDNKPPLLYLVYAFFNADQFFVRTASLISGLLSVILFFILSKRLFKTSQSTLISTSLFALLLSTPLLEGNIANAENFMLLPIIAAAYIVVEIQAQKKQKRAALLLLTAGLFLSIGFLFKVVALFDFCAFLLFLLFTYLPQHIAPFRIKQIPQYFSILQNHLFPFLVGFLTPITCAILFFVSKGAFSDFVNAALIQNVGYISYGNTFIVSQGLLIIKLILLGSVVTLLFLKRRQLSYATLFIYLWLAFSLFNALFSQRPYTHYLLVLIPSFSLLFGSLFEEFFLEKKVQIAKKGAIEKISLVCFLLVLLIISKNFQLYGKNIAYYKNFLTFITNHRTVTDYQRFFDKKTPRDYEIAQYLKTRLKDGDSVFIWGNNAQVYALINKLPPGKFIVAYHITAYDTTRNETRDELTKVKPRFVILMPDLPPIPYSLFGYNQKLAINEASIYERIF